MTQDAGRRDATRAQTPFEDEVAQVAARAGAERREHNAAEPVDAPEDEL